MAQRSGSFEIPAPRGSSVVLEWMRDFVLDTWRARIVEKNSEWHREMGLPFGGRLRISRPALRTPARPADAASRTISQTHTTRP